MNKVKTMLKQETQCPACDDNLPRTWLGVLIIYEDGEWDKFCDYTCFQQRMVRIWQDEIIGALKLEVEKL